MQLAHHASTAFQAWALNLYNYYAQQMAKLHHCFPNLQFNFPCSIFACCSINFGLQTVTVEHLDSYLNYLFRWCAITALGNFDYCKGGHFVLWDLGLVIQLPPGWTILIPSAFLQHSNTKIQPGETRFSLTQYTAGGLF
ncbi:hypothetical protein GYMLUDRAFT_167428 [Collybiopsis luxurians FD-317 M1]|uniref:Uncharacterized protein n=1 Tax=Collybiopsis luxurians FD-317 M1 TaxID=944289 RepID=A0A0D0CX04_9AGAR|nr:hypothetical protein GYMLUDRAFT_167428 [Collybiopsis luxurians FD-317 M1]